MPSEQNVQDPHQEAIARGDVIPEPKSDASAEGRGIEATPPPEELETPTEEGQAAFDEPEAEASENDDEPQEPRIPKSRFDQAVQKERDRATNAETQLKQYQQREQQQRDAANFEASQKKQTELLKQHSSLLADGELDKASEVMAEVLQLRDDMQNARMEAKAANATNAAKIEVQYDATVARLEQEYPELNPDGEAFDTTTVGNVQAMMAGIMQNEGANPAMALQKATDILLKPLKEAQAKSLREQPSEEAVETGMRRRKQQIDKNIKAAEAQPPATDDVGKDHDQTGGPLNYDAVQNMTFEEFMQVPDNELAKMRGDYLN